MKKCALGFKNLNSLVCSLHTQNVELEMKPPLFSSGCISPWFITGLVDAEGSFIVNIVKDNSRSLGFLILIHFEIALNEKDKILLEMLKEYFGIGNIFFNSHDNTYKLKEGDIFSVTAKNQSSTLAQVLKNAFYSVTGQGTQIVAQSSGVVQSTGN